LKIRPIAGTVSPERGPRGFKTGGILTSWIPEIPLRADEFEMKRWAWFSVCMVGGLVLVGCGWLLPAYLRAVDAGVIRAAGRDAPGQEEQRRKLADDGQLGAVELLSQAARSEEDPQVAKIRNNPPDWQVWGAPPPRFAKLFDTERPGTNSAAQGFTELIIRSGNRENALAFLAQSPQPLVQELLHTRALTNTAIFAPSQSSAGQAFDAAVAVCGLLADGRHLSTAMDSRIAMVAADANRGGNPQKLEQALLDMMSLGQRFNWGQLAIFVSRVEDPETLRLLAALEREHEAQSPLLFSAVVISGKPAELAEYLSRFNQSGWDDVGYSLRFGKGALDELLARGQRLLVSNFRERAAAGPVGALLGVATDYCLRMPRFGLIVKWLLYLCGGFLLAMGMHFAWPAASALERPLQVRGFHFAREILFALGFLLVALLLSEPFLAQDSQRVEMPFRLRLPMAGGAVPAGAPGANPSFMNHEVLLTMLLFFVLQCLLYIASLVKLAEIRRQRVASRMKLKLLENEEHLFDAGLYLGFLGTIISLILVSLGVFKQPSLMAAYSSTSFGILFVVLFKVMHLRPTRRMFLLESEASGQDSAVPDARSAAATL
jgi:hypothetical protein